MSVNLIIAVTDNNWFKYLSRRTGLAEVNFWTPSEKHFKALKPGELFLFKLHSPFNFIVGGGIFAHETLMPCSTAWDFFGEAKVFSRNARHDRQVPQGRPGETE